jgi:hypothetical protein
MHVGHNVHFTFIQQNKLEHVNGVCNFDRKNNVYQGFYYTSCLDKFHD